MGSSGRGGYRQGSGRPSNWNLRPITVIKIPEPIKEQVLFYAHLVDDIHGNVENLRSDLETVTIPITQLRSMVEEIWQDEVINRNKKDRAAIKKALTILIDKLEDNHSHKPIDNLLVRTLPHDKQVSYVLGTL